MVTADQGLMDHGQRESILLIGCTNTGVVLLAATKLLTYVPGMVLSEYDSPHAEDSITVATNSRSMIFVTIVSCARWCVCVCLIPYILAPVYAFRCVFDVSAGVYKEENEHNVMTCFHF